MASRVTDRMTINYAGPTECEKADAFRKLVGERGVNRILKQLVFDYLQQHEKRSTSKNES